MGWLRTVWTKGLEQVVGFAETGSSRLQQEQVVRYSIFKIIDQLPR